MSFFKSWAFWFLFGCFVGVIIGFFVAALCSISARESRREEKLGQSLMKEEDNQKKNGDM